MPGVQISHELVNEVPLVGDTCGPLIPKMVVRVAQWDGRLQGSFLGQSQPVIISKRHVNPS